MAGTYQAIAWKFESEPGIVLSVGTGISVKVRIDGAGSDAAESPLTTDANGEIASGSIAAGSAGTKVHFRIENYHGMAQSVAQLLT